MVRTPKRSHASIQTLIEQTYTSGKVPRQTYLLLTSTLLAGHRVSPEERQQIIRVLDSLQLGRLRMVD